MRAAEARAEPLDTAHFVPQSNRMQAISQSAFLSQSTFTSRPGASLLVGLVLLLAAVPALQLQATEFPKGSFSATSPRGKVTLKFEDKDKFSLKSEDGKVLVAGTYKVSKTQIEFTDETGPIAAKDAKPGKYEWKIESDKLSFSKIEDDAEGRSKALTRTPWTSEK